MRVIIGGAGRVGIALARALADEKYDIVIVDNDSEQSQRQALDCLRQWKHHLSRSPLGGGHHLRKCLRRSNALG